MGNGVRPSSGGWLIGIGVTIMFGAPAALIAGFEGWPIVGIAAIVIGLAISAWGYFASRRSPAVTDMVDSSHDLIVRLAELDGEISQAQHRREAAVMGKDLRQADIDLVDLRAKRHVLETRLDLAQKREAAAVDD